MKTINMKSTHATNKMYRKKCLQYEKYVKMMAMLNACQNDAAAEINLELKKVLLERKVLLKKLLECNVVVEQTQLYYKGKCEAKFYKDCCKERVNRKKYIKKSQGTA